MYTKEIKQRFDRKIEDNIFSCGDMILRWDARKEQKGKHGKFDNLWFGSFHNFKTTREQYLHIADFGR